MTDRSVPLATHLKRAAVTSILYIWAYFVTADLVAPLQTVLLPSVVMSILFLPHGIRVLAAWLYGWRSLAYLLPGALLCNLHFAGERAFDPDILAGTFTSLAAAPLAFTLVRLLWPSAPLAIGQTRLLTIVAVGSLASVFNLTLLNLVHSLGSVESVVIFLGDTSGLLGSLMLLWLVLRVTGKPA